jgi:hypothetical protein
MVLFTHNTNIFLMPFHPGHMAFHVGNAGAPVANVTGCRSFIFAI